MRRREVVAALGGAAALGPSAIRAQQSRRVHRIGVLAQDLQPGLLDAFRAGLRDLGYTEGENIAIEVRNAGGKNDRLAEMVNDLLSRKVDVILAVNTPAAQAAKTATETIPIVILKIP